MDRKEAAIRLWFDMWRKKTDMGIRDIFVEDVVYTESWGPEYRGVEKVKLWFDECTTRQDVLKWDILRFFHRDDQTAVQWYFQFQYHGQAPQAFDGVSLIRWTPDGKIARLQEFGCNAHRYDPYRNGAAPEFEDTPPMWF